MIRKVLLTTVVLGHLSSPIEAQPSPGAAAFEKKCYSCHNIGGGDKTGPDLKGLLQRRSRDWVIRFTQSPAATLRAGDPTAEELFRSYSPAVMPDQSLDPAELDAILQLIEQLTSNDGTFVPPGAKLSRPVKPEDIPAGRALFTGQTSLAAGGPACISCHGLQGIGPFGGGTLGPDLTAANLRYRDPELIAILQNPNFPTMNTLFANRPLNEDEVVQLFALLQNARRNAVDPAPYPPLDLSFPLLGIALLVVAVAVMNRIWKHRLKGVRQQVIRTARGEFV
jgi:mono/diheme cytochrome c family protein